MGLFAPFLALIVSISGSIVGNWLVGKQRYRIWDTKGRYIQVIGVIILISTALITLLSVDITDNTIMKWFWLVSIILILGFQSILEWIYLKETKEHLVTLITLGIGLFFILLFMF